MLSQDKHEYYKEKHIIRYALWSPLYDSKAVRPPMGVNMKCGNWHSNSPGGLKGSFNLEAGLGEQE